LKIARKCVIVLVNTLKKECAMKNSFIKAGFLLILIAAAMGIGGAQCVEGLIGGPTDGQQGPTTGTILGKVTDKLTGDPIAGATVTTDPSTQTKTTGSNGNYIISDVNPGTYIVTAEAEGYEPNSSDPVRVEAGDEKTVNIELVEEGADTEPPEITHTPVTAAEEGTAITITATVTDNVAVTGVKLFYRAKGASNFTSVDMAAAGTTTTYTATIPAASVTSAGLEYYIEATDGTSTSVDPEGAPDEAEPYSITVSTAQPPVITHTPVTTGNISTAITITATVTDNVAVVGVKLFYRVKGTSSFTSVDMAAGGTANTYSSTIPAASVTAAGLEYYIEATDGTSKTFSPTTAPTVLHSITVADTTPPTITHTAVTTATVGAAISIIATVSDNVAVSTVKLYYKKSTDPDSTYSTSFVNMTLSSGGVYSGAIPSSLATLGTVVQYYIEASDGTNTSRNPTEAPTTVNSINIADLTPPTVVSVTPADLATGISVNTTISATFSEDMLASSISASSFTLTKGSVSVSGTVTYDSSTKKAIFTPSSPLDDSTTFTVKILGGSAGVKDAAAAGNPLATDKTWTFTTEGIPPTVASVTPTDGATGVQVSTVVISATFSEQVTSVNTNTFTLTKAGSVLVSGAVTYDSANKKATFTPSAALDYSTTFTAKILSGSSGVKDTAGNPLAADKIWTFTTELTPPDLQVTSVTTPATGLPNSTASVTFSIKNFGGTTSAASTVKAWFSTNTSLDGSDTDLGSKTLATIAAGATVNDSITVTIPSVTGGTYYIIIEADPSNTVAETIETNNTNNASISISTVLYVDTSVGNDGYSGTSPTFTSGTNGPFKTINTAITYAKTLSGTKRINVATGTYQNPSGSTTSTANFVDAPNISLYGGYNSGFTTRDISTYVTTIAAPGSTNLAAVYVGNGTTPVYITNPDTSIIDGFTINGGGTTGSQYGVWIKPGNSPTFSNNTISGGTGSSIYAIYIEANNASLTTSPVIKNNTVNGGSGSSSYAIYLYGTTSTSGAGQINPSITGNTINGGTGSAYGIYFYSGCKANNPLISGNQISAPSATSDSYGIYLYFKCDALIENNTITLTGGTSTSSDRWGIYTYSGPSPTIQYNTIRTADSGDTVNIANSSGIRISSTGSPIIKGNTIIAGNGSSSGTSTYSRGIWLDSVSGVPKITNNFIRVIKGRVTRGIDIVASVANYSPVIVNNTIDGGNAIGTGTTDNAIGIGIYRSSTSYSATPIIANNIIFTSGGTKPRYGIYEGCSGGCSPTHLENNLIFDTPDGLYFDENGTAITDTLALNGVAGPKATGTTNLSGNITLSTQTITDVFVSPAVGNTTFDFHLKAGSPAIDAGKNTNDPTYGSVTDDIDKASRTGTYDIGADEK
jgi:hypothetical protein